MVKSTLGQADEKSLFFIRTDLKKYRIIYITYSALEKILSTKCSSQI